MAPDTNAVLNFEELSVMFNRSIAGVKFKVKMLRKQGKIPNFDRSKQLNKYRSYYSPREVKMILKLRESHTYEQIAQMMGRTRQGIAGICLKEGKPKFQVWTASEKQLLLNHIKLDEYGIVENYDELQRLFDRSRPAIMRRVAFFRSEGKLPSPTRRGTPANQDSTWNHFYPDEIYAEPRRSTNSGP